MNSGEDLTWDIILNIVIIILIVTIVYDILVPPSSTCLTMIDF